jgi:hypothetical protein
METRRTTPIPWPVAWKGADFSNDFSWIYRLPQTALGEIDDALAAMRSRGDGGLHNMKKSDFPLPSIESALGDLLKEVEHGRGFVLIRGLPVEKYTVAEIETIYLGIGSHFGTALSQNDKGELLQQIEDIGQTYGATNVRGSRTNANMQHHLDIATDIVALLCVRKAKSGGISGIANAMAVFNEFLEKYPPEYLERLYSGFCYDLRGTERPGGSPITGPIPVFGYYAGYLSCTYAHSPIIQASEKIGKPLTEFDTAVLNAFNEVTARPDMQLEMDLQPGDIQILNNHMIVHRRTAFEDYDDPARKRLMLRLWLTPPDPRPLAPDAINACGELASKRLGHPNKSRIREPL